MNVSTSICKHIPVDAKCRLINNELGEKTKMELKEAILEQCRSRGIDPYRETFKPSDLGIRASDYGSFSDYCSESETCSGKWNTKTILKVAERDRSGRPRKYILLEKG